MNQFLKDTMRGIKGRGRDSARKLLWPVLLGIAACSFGLAGFGFLTASMYFALSAVLGAVLAALLIGVGMTFLAGVLFLVAFKKAPKPVLTDASKAPPEASDANFLSLAAFTAAYVLARQFSESERD